MISTPPPEPVAGQVSEISATELRSTSKRRLRSGAYIAAGTSASTLSQTTPAVTYTIVTTSATDPSCELQFYQASNLDHRQMSGQIPHGLGSFFSGTDPERPNAFALGAKRLLSEHGLSSSPAAFSNRDQGMAEDTVSLTKKLQLAFIRAAEERFEAGMRSAFAAEIASTIRTGGANATNAILRQLFSPTTSNDVAAETLRSVAEIDDDSTLTQRLGMLEAGLMHVDPVVRDAAILGIESVGHESAAPALKAALRRERIATLRQDLQAVIDQIL